MGCPLCILGAYLVFVCVLYLGVCIRYILEVYLVFSDGVFGIWGWVFALVFGFVF